ncbi:MAG: hypothetical protein LBN29_04150 [Mediterranea sp.]|jgi:hypothetical protein|nr:hypothetical protein [Mediterranea sp.]
MQTQLALFSSDVKLVNDTLGFRDVDGFRYYLHNGSPIACHRLEDRNSYRFTIGSLLFNGLCTRVELTKALGEHAKNIERYEKTYREKGAAWFFRRKETRGQCYKVTDTMLTEIQRRLDAGESKYRIARDLGISEGSVSYHLKHGKLKKKR